jgi:amidase
VADNPEPRGDFWRTQRWITLPASSAVRPPSYAALRPAAPEAARRALAGRRFGVPRIYINADPEAGSAVGGRSPGIGGPTGQRITTWTSILELFDAARADLGATGATVVDVDFPVISNYEGDRPTAPTIKTRGLISAAYLDRDRLHLAAWAWEDFLAANNDSALNTLAGVDGSRIFPTAGWRAARPLRRIRRRHQRLPRLRTRPPAERNGVWVANGNLALRDLGIPTVTVPMGTMRDIGMSVGLTFAGRVYPDSTLLRLAAAFEATGSRRTPPRRTPALPWPPPHSPNIWNDPKETP